MTTPLSAAYYQSSRELPDEGRVDQRAQQPHVPRRDRRQLVELLPAASGPRLRPLRRPVGPRPHRHRQPASSTTAAPTTATRTRSGGSRRATSACSYFKDGWGGSHDFKFGFDIKRDRRSLLPRPAVRRLLPRRRTAAVADRHLQHDGHRHQRREQPSVWLNDTWKLSNRLTMNLGLRYGHYTRPVAGAGVRAQRPPALHWPAGTDRARATQAFIAPRTVGARTVANTHDVSPRVGFAYDLTGDNRTVVKAYFGQTPLELGRRAGRQGEPGRHRAAALRLRAVHARPDHAVRPERQPAARRPARARRVQLNAGRRRLRARRPRPQCARSPTSSRPASSARSVSGLSAPRLLRLQGHARHLGRGRHHPRAAVHGARTPSTIPGPDNIAGHRRRPAVPDLRSTPGRPGQDRVYTNPEGNDADFHTVELAVNRRFSGKWMVLTSGRLHLVDDGARPDRTSPSRCRPATPAATRTGRRTAAVRRRVRARDLDHLELQGDRALRDAVGHRHVGLVARAERPELRPHAQHARSPATAPAPSASSRSRANRYDTISILDLRLDKSFNCPARPGGSPSSSTASTC